MARTEANTETGIEQDLEMRFSIIEKLHRVGQPFTQDEAEVVMEYALAARENITSESEMDEIREEYENHGYDRGIEDGAEQFWNNLDTAPLEDQFGDVESGTKRLIARLIGIALENLLKPRYKADKSLLDDIKDEIQRLKMGYESDGEDWITAIARCDNLCLQMLGIDCGDVATIAAEDAQKFDDIKHTWHGIVP